MNNHGNLGGMIMKTRNLIIFMAVMAAASCAKEIVPAEDNPTVEPVLVPMEFTASMETKAYIAEDGKTVNWNDEESICLFDDLGGDQKFTAGAGGATAWFSGSVTEGATEFYALYPYREAAQFDASTKTVTSKLFPDQTAVVGSYAMGDGGAVMVAKADGNTLSFKNMTSHIKFTLAEDMTDVKSITLVGNRNEILCGTYSVDWNDGMPSISVTKPDTYVTLRNSDGSALVPGDYYFTVLPVEFSEGFTVILSKIDGSQVAKKTTNSITSLNVRNQILPMKPLASKDYSSHLNYFVRYNDGFDITIGGYTFSKETHPGGKLVNDTYGNGGVGADGIYFVDPKCSTAQFSKAQAYSSVIVVGTDASLRSPFDFYRQARPFDKGTVILLANLDCTIGAKNAFGQNTGTTGHAFAEFGNLILDNCHFRNIGKNFFEFKNSAFAKFNLWVEDCEFGFNASEVYVFNASSLESAAQNITVKNNVFYSETGTAMTKFKLIHSDKLSIEKLNVDKNTFVGTILDGSLCRVGTVSSTLDFARNFCVECSAAADVKMIDWRVNVNKDKVTGVVTNNYYFSTGAGKVGMGVGASALTSMETINSTAVLASSPLSAVWNPAKGVFGAYVVADGVSNTVGAWRDDMKVTEETPDTPAANYVSINLGTI